MQNIHLGSHRNFVFSPSSLQISHSLKDGWTNILVPSLRFTRKTDRLSTRCWKSSQSNVPCGRTHIVWLSLLFTLVHRYYGFEQLHTLFLKFTFCYRIQKCDVQRAKAAVNLEIICWCWFDHITQNEVEEESFKGFKLYCDILNKYLIDFEF